MQRENVHLLKIYGLEKDLQSMNQGNRDKFERHLSQLIADRLGKRFLPYLRIRFATLDAKLVCAVYVRSAAPQRAFLKSDSGLELYIRTGNSTRSLSVPDIYDYF